MTLSGAGPVVVQLDFAPTTLLGRALSYLRRQSQPVHLVGGCVRDLLLGREVHDLDVATSAHAISLARALANDLGGAFVAIDPKRDTGRAILTGADGERIHVDCAAWRAPTLAEDLRLRDFTINALAVAPDQSPAPVIDVTGGLADLRERLVRAVSDRSLVDDPVRGLRAVRLAAELAFLGFRLETETAALLRRHAALLEVPAPERVRDELVRILAADQPQTWLRLMAGLGQLAVVLPEVEALRGLAQTPPHRYDAFEHTVRVVEAAGWQMRWLAGEVQPTDRLGEIAAEALLPFRSALAEHFSGRDGRFCNRSQLFVWAALAHDWGKPATRSEELAADGSVRIRFIGHEQVSAELAAAALRRLRFSEAEVSRVTAVVAHHLRPLELFASSAWPSRRAVYRYFRAAGDAGVEVALLSLADLRGTEGPDLDEDLWRRHVALTTHLLDTFFHRRQEVVAPSPLLTGRDLKERFGLAPGPQIGRLLAAVTEAQAAGELRTTDEALAFVASQLANP